MEDFRNYTAFPTPRGALKSLRRREAAAVKHPREYVRLPVAGLRGHALAPGGDFAKVEEEENAFLQKAEEEWATEAPAELAMRNLIQPMERLIAEGTSSDPKNGNGSPALVLAAMNGHLDALKLLRRHGANLEATNTYGQTALILAVRNGKPDCAEALLEWGADKDAADKNIGTALHWAAQQGQLECARLLVRARADRAKKNSSGQTALEVARERGKAEVAALLEQADANDASIADSQPARRASKSSLSGARQSAMMPAAKKMRPASKTSTIKGACVPPCVVRRCTMRR